MEFKYLILSRLTTMQMGNFCSLNFSRAIIVGLIGCLPNFKQAQSGNPVCHFVHLNAIVDVSLRLVEVPQAPVSSIQYKRLRGNLRVWITRPLSKDYARIQVDRGHGLMEVDVILIPRCVQWRQW
jgi:hypothetical protein